MDKKDRKKHVVFDGFWAPIPGFEGSYWASVSGDIRSKYRILQKSVKKKKGYCYYRFSHNGKMSSHSGHRLVALTFIPNLKGLPYVNHINQIPSDNRVCNLEWISNRDNVLHGYSKAHRFNTPTKRGLLLRGTPLVNKRSGGVYSSLRAANKAEGGTRVLYRIVEGRSKMWRLATDAEKKRFFPELYGTR